LTLLFATMHSEILTAPLNLLKQMTPWTEVERTTKMTRLGLSMICLFFPAQHSLAYVHQTKALVAREGYAMDVITNDHVKIMARKLGESKAEKKEQY
jgi:hypothetical protein